MSGIQQTLLGGSPAGGYQIERSLRFNSADSAYLNRTAGVAPTSASIGTLSFWARLGAMSGGADIFSSEVPELNVRMSAVTTNALTVYLANGNNGTVTFAPLFRDPSAWYHIVLKFDTQNGTAANRVVGYVNGTTMTKTTDTHISAGNLGFMNNGVISRIGTRTVSAGFYYSGYLTEINFIDGQALTPSSFGQTNASTGVWEPVKYTGTYGTNGFYLNFSDNSNTTSTTLGKDSSGNGNNWTPNNFSVTAGAGNDSLVDTPTSYGSDTGVGGEVRGNYCTWNPLDSSGNTLANGNLQVTEAGSSYNQTLATQAIDYKTYAEFTLTTLSGQIGIQSGARNDTGSGGYSSMTIGYNTTTSGSYTAGEVNTAGDSASGTTYTAPSANDVFMIAVDPSNGKVWMGLQGTWFNSGNPAAGTGQVGTISTSSILRFVFGRMAGSGGVVYANFGQRPFAYTAPSGFKALCTQNLPTPTIGATSTTQANRYFDVGLWTGNGVNGRDIANLYNFNPDAVWIKSRSNAIDHNLADVLRSWKELYPNLTNAEGSQQMNAPTNNGLSGLPNANGYNINNYTYASWVWKANGAGSTNTAGTITSTVSANTTAGFSIVTYTGNGTGGATVGHGLGVSPSWIITKSRSNATNWMVWTDKLTTNYALEGLNTTGAEVSGGSPSKYIRAVSSTTFTIGNDISVNQSASYTYVAYCFAAVAGYSAFGSYTGNGSTSGPFIYTGFRPALIMMKASGAAGAWTIFDSKRNPSNGATFVLQPNSNAAEGTFTSSEAPDLLSNGFRLNFSYADYNSNGVAYIYAAFAESPFKYSLAR